MSDPMKPTPKFLSAMEHAQIDFTISRLLVVASHMQRPNDNHPAKLADGSVNNPQTQLMLAINELAAIFPNTLLIAKMAREAKEKRN